MKTESRLHLGTAADGRQAIAELATVEMNGQKFTNQGALISEDLILGYVSADARTLRTWSGETIMALHETGRRLGFHRTLLKSYAGEYAGRRWHGRGLGEEMIIRMRPGRAIK